MADYATKQDLKSLEDKIDKRFDDLAEILNIFANDVNKKFEQQDAELRKLNQKYDHLVNTIDGFLARIDHYETELAARDAEIARLRTWVEAIAKKTGVSQPL
jgi:chromosome segregation ATPase